jgi:hypothetical protein
MVARSKRMASLGRKGGLAGGPARARALAARRRAEIAQRAARARWSRPLDLIAPPTTPAGLHAFVAHYGSSLAPPRADLEARALADIALASIRASRKDSALARMLPVFLWRVRDRLDRDALVQSATKSGLAAEAGFFLTVAAQLGVTAVFDDAISTLRPRAHPDQPSYFFEGVRTRPFERAAADLNTPAEARGWGLLMNMPWDSFASYFAKAAPL